MKPLEAHVLEYNMTVSWFLDTITKKDCRRIVSDILHTGMSGEEIQKLEDEEKNSLQMFTEYAAAATSFWQFWKYNIHDPMAEKAENHLKTAAKADAVRAIDNDEFVKRVVG